VYSDDVTSVTITYSLGTSGEKFSKVLRKNLQRNGIGKALHLKEPSLQSHGENKENPERPQ
jgi:hypothetical protein